jgi:hypothetical protein
MICASLIVTAAVQGPRVILDHTVPKLVIGQQVRLRAHVVNATGQTLDAPIAWRATSSSYISLAADGRVTGIRPGRVTIIALTSDASARFDVEVIRNTLNWITVTPERTEVRVGEGVRLRFEAFEQDGTAIGGLSPTWSLAPGPGTIGDDGVFVAHEPGAHVVYAHIADRIASATIRVLPR